MGRIGWLIEKLASVSPALEGWLEKRLKSIPLFKRKLEKEYNTLLSGLEESLKPYRDDFSRYKKIPERGLAQEDILEQMQALKQREATRWQAGYASGAVYHGGEKHIQFLDQVYGMYSQANPLHADLWPSINKYEAEIVAMTADMLGGSAPETVEPEQICGTVTSGGTESILLAMKAYRDWARERRGIKRPEMVFPETAHAAFDKAAQYFEIKPIRIPVDAGYKADLKAARKAVTRNTIVLIGSAPSFPHGIIDPIAELSEIARQKGIGFHTDACLGGFVLPWATKLGYPVPPFDFKLPGVTSISVDTHKYGYAPKGSSVILYRGLELRRCQYFTIADWPGGLYLSPTFAGSRPGGLSAACWAALLETGEGGYLQASKAILETAAWIREQIESTPDLFVLGDPLWVIAFGSQTVDIYRVLDRMAQRGWSLNGLHRPSCIHLCVTLCHTQPGVAERFVHDLQAAVLEVKSSPPEAGGMAPVYGMAATMPLTGLVDDILERYLDILYKP
ncbi:MAG TPA: aminotransferase class V-fold PLP-dependent enzyme [Anaerolineales bacterium]|nr:aminotransferase class V-fold PLP-dependent enzyme [Anaerolineales bacterium]